MSVKCLDAGVLSKIKRERSEAFLIKLIDLFLKEGPMRIQEAWDAGKAKDLRKLAVAAHILRCLAENIGALTIRDLAASAESLASSSDKQASLFLANILFDLEIAFAETRSCLLIARDGISENR
jgi:hypothetical protein